MRFESISNITSLVAGIKNPPKLHRGEYRSGLGRKRTVAFDPTVTCTRLNLGQPTINKQLSSSDEFCI